VLPSPFSKERALSIPFRLLPAPPLSYLVRSPVPWRQMRVSPKGFYTLACFLSAPPIVLRGYALMFKEPHSTLYSIRSTNPIRLRLSVASQFHQLVFSFDLCAVASKLLSCLIFSPHRRYRRRARLARHHTNSFIALLSVPSFSILLISLLPTALHHSGYRMCFTPPH
jgi:hypothetical protein